jgi:hypothetical protein
MGAPPHAFTQIIRDAIGNDVIGKRPARVFPVEADNVETVARRHRLGAELAGRQGKQRLFEFRCGLAAGDLAKIAALRRRGAT